MKSRGLFCSRLLLELKEMGIAYSANLDNFMGKFLKIPWIGIVLIMGGFLSSCAPTLDVTIENFVLKENSKSQIFYFNYCSRTKGKCGGWKTRSFTIDGFEKTIRTFKYTANPIYIIVNGDVKARVILKRNGRTCADYVIQNWGKRYEEYAVRCEEK